MRQFPRFFQGHPLVPVTYTEPETGRAYPAQIRLDRGTLIFLTTELPDCPTREDQATARRQLIQRLRREHVFPPCTRWQFLEFGEPLANTG